ncbi:transposase, partial [Leptospira levettii]|nr:transposase [Leptospira levettii]
TSTIATQNGCVFFDSVPDQKANTLGVLLRKTVPYESPLFSDEVKFLSKNILTNRHEIHFQM